MRFLLQQGSHQRVNDPIPQLRSKSWFELFLSIFYMYLFSGSCWAMNLVFQSTVRLSLSPSNACYKLNILFFPLEITWTHSTWTQDTIQVLFLTFKFWIYLCILLAGFFNYNLIFFCLIKTICFIFHAIMKECKSHWIRLVD